MTDEKMREEFEAWASSVLLQEKVTQDFIKGMREGDTYSLTGFSADHARKYLTGIVSAGWMAWQESRAAIEVEWPKERSVNGHWPEQVASDMGFNDGVESCRDAIESLGLKVKP